MDKIKKFLFVNTNAKQTFAKNTFWLVSSEAFGRILKLGLIIYAARILSADGWGIFAYALSISSLLMIFSDFGMGGLATREIVQKKESGNFINTLIVLKIFVTFISALLVLIMSPHISNIPEARTLFPVISVILFFDSVRELGIAINRATEKMEREMYVKISMNMTILILGMILLTVYQKPLSLAISYATGSVVGFLIIIYFIKDNIKNIFHKTDIKLFSRILKMAWPFAIVTLTGVIMGNTDVYMLGIWKDAKEIGFYASSQRIQQFIILIPAMIATASFPVMSKLANEDNNHFRLIFEKTLTLIMIIGIPITIGGIMLADKIIFLAFGQGYLPAISIFQIMMVTLMFLFPLVLLSNSIFAYNKQKELSKAYILGMITNVIINLALIPKWGAAGAAFATLISSAIITVFIWIKMKTINYFLVFPRLKKGIIASIFMLAILIFLIYLKINIILSVLIAGATYLCFLIMLKDTTIKEIKNII